MPKPVEGHLFSLTFMSWRSFDWLDDRMLVGTIRPI